PTIDAGSLLRVDGGIHFSRLRPRVLSSDPRAFVVHDLFILAGCRWGELCYVHALAAGTVSHRMPGQRVCLRHFHWALCRRGHHIPGGRRRLLLSHDRNTRRADFTGLHHWAFAIALWKRDEGRDAAGVVRDLPIAPHDLESSYHGRTRIG